ncbi:unnamed protein product [Porites evermanni]|uniref:Uncharacterized protein n=1 Tax=Porites evermanni TaxID=104178 RepID=A0ABN8SQV0_9CNID|nr:unnamed protein product [Porites evermanni]
MKEQLKQVERLLNGMVAKIIDQVSSNQTEERKLLETKIGNQMLKLKGEIWSSRENQTKELGQELQQQTQELKREIKDSEVNQTKKFKQEIQNETMGLTHEIKDFEICATKGNQTVEVALSPPIAPKLSPLELLPGYAEIVPLNRNLSKDEVYKREISTPSDFNPHVPNINKTISNYSHPVSTAHPHYHRFSPGFHYPIF